MDPDYEWDKNEEEVVDAQDDHDDIESYTISWDSYKYVDNIDGLDFIMPKPYVLHHDTARNSICGSHAPTEPL